MRSMGRLCKKKEKNVDYARAHEGRKGEEASPTDTLFCYLRPQFNYVTVVHARASIVNKVLETGPSYDIKPTSDLTGKQPYVLG